MLQTLRNGLKHVWAISRRLSGDDAYERYLAHHAQLHGASQTDEAEHQPLSREAFFRQWQNSKWDGIKRCC